MYNIIQLNDKSLSELQTIAQELGIKKPESLKKEELVYKILDEQAIAGATKKVAADKQKDERKGERQKRSRVSVKKENVDKVASANQNGDIIREEMKAPANIVAKAATNQENKQPVVAETQATETTESATPAKRMAMVDGKAIRPGARKMPKPNMAV